MSATDSQALLDILQMSNKALSTREISARIRSSIHKQTPDYTVGMQLRSMIPAGLVEQCGGRWNKVKSQVGDPSRLKHFPQKLPTPCLSPETLNLLGSLGKHFISEIDDSVKWKESRNDDVTTGDLTDRWSKFRRLLSYYRQCIRNEEGADASAFQNQLGNKFLYLYKTGNWYPHPKIPWQTSIPVGPHVTEFLSSLPAPDTEESLVLGYPVYAYYDKRNGEPDISIIRPIFYFSIEHYLYGSALKVKNDSPRVEINLGWLDYAFKKNPTKKKAFLSACGFINRPKPIDEAPGLEGSEPSPTLEMLVKVLACFMPHKIREPLDIHFIPDRKLDEPFESGIYNRAVGMLAQRTRYTATLLKELKAIGNAPSQELDRTALTSIFARKKDDDQKVNSFEICHEEIVLDTTKLNAEQRHAVASLLSYPVTVITGPPGTGKSQVVSSAAANARIKNQTVLFASRNHKAIDAVMDRMISNEGELLMARANSKNDPNLKFTFEEAIKCLLAEHQNSNFSEKLVQIKEEITTLLEKRGIVGRYARQAAKHGEALGRLEDRLTYLKLKLPTALIAYLDDKPNMFPVKAVHRLADTIDSMFLKRKEGTSSFIEWLQRLSYLLAVFPSYLYVRRRFQPIPRTPELATIPSVASLKNLQSDLSTIVRAAEFATVRINCLPIEDRIRELPPLAKLTAEIIELTERLVELVPKAITLDSLSRQGLPPESDREELDGLRAAIRSLRTGLVLGEIQIDTINTIKNNLPVLLKRFPCWGVTNLSVGSHIPLISGMFDLAIIDEASQSDIPSAIPILFRAKRAGVVGDPCQLNHSSKLTTAKDTMIRQQASIVEIRDLRFSYTENSIFDIFRGTNNVEPIFLNETYRSASAIAGYSNQVFYGGRLRVATDHSKLKVPSGMVMGIHWTDVQGEVKNAGGSGCFCQNEIDKIDVLLRSMLIDNNFLGTIGIVTPFRQQANRLRDALFESDSEFYHAIVRADCHVDTAHGFQGDERDVIIFSLCGGPGMPSGSRSFLESTGNLFNVAISRARAVVHVVGNRKWAARCGIKHVEQLAKPAGKATGTFTRGEWYPHESPWEKIFFDALSSVGLDPRPQLPVAGRRLDMALVRDDKSLKIDIEVDGDCHRNPDGSRKQDDVWRDMELQSLGWKVMRFWTYQLRENIHQCTNKVLNTWRQHE